MQSHSEKVWHERTRMGLSEFAEYYNILFSGSCLTLMAWLELRAFYLLILIYAHLQTNRHSLPVYICHYQNLEEKQFNIVFMLITKKEFEFNGTSTHSFDS